MNNTMLTYYIRLYQCPETLFDELLLPLCYRLTYLNFEDIWTENKNEMINEIINLSEEYKNRVFVYEVITSFLKRRNPTIVDHSERRSQNVKSNNICTYFFIPYYNKYNPLRSWPVQYMRVSFLQSIFLSEVPGILYHSILDWRSGCRIRLSEIH